jgi:tRNA(Ile)-lysidine synthase
MEINILPGRYVLAVSGGVDSMALLHALKDVAGVELIVAHFDHGIRTDSGVDRQLVQDEAERRDLKFELKEDSNTKHRQ